VNELRAPNRKIFSNIQGDLWVHFNISCLFLFLKLELETLVPKSNQGR